MKAAYVGSFGRHLGENVQLNTVPYGAEFLPQNQNPQTNTPLNDNYFRPYGGYGNVPMQIWEGNSSYHSFQFQATRRYAHGVQYGVNYTYSKAMDYSEGDSTTSGGVARYLNRAVWNYGLAGYDRPNILTFYFLWDIPRLSKVLPNPIVKAVFDGWQLSDMTSFISGQPLAISMSESPTINFTGGGDGSRPLMVASPNLPSGQRSVSQWYNVAAFAEPIAMSPSTCNAAGCPPVSIASIGDMPAMAIRGPGVNNWNTSLFKNFRVKERYNFQLRMEAYNTVQPHSVFGSRRQHSVQRRGREYNNGGGDHHLGPRPALPATGPAIDVLSSERKKLTSSRPQPQCSARSSYPLSTGYAPLRNRHCAAPGPRCCGGFRGCFPAREDR